MTVSQRMCVYAARLESLDGGVVRTHEIVNELLAGAAEIERLERMLVERDATIARLRGPASPV